ncbi:MAG: hypothetical protein KL785_09250 [Brevundimonas sp.]|nr:hypothetical protein [Brevundimonas sp.]
MSSSSRAGPWCCATATAIWSRTTSSSAGGKAHTGGVRVINRNQTVRNNYMEGLAGDGFASAITVMYGVPDSPINRYHQVVGAVIEHNTIVGARSLSSAPAWTRNGPRGRSTAGSPTNLIVNADGERDPFAGAGRPVRRRLRRQCPEPRRLARLSGRRGSAAGRADARPRRAAGPRGPGPASAPAGIFARSRGPAWASTGIPRPARPPGWTPAPRSPSFRARAVSPPPPKPPARATS